MTGPTARFGLSPVGATPLTALETAYGSALEPASGPSIGSASGARARIGRAQPTHAPGGDVPQRAEAAYRALARAIRPALVRGPCLVSFSGGMDSSFVLAVAAGVARAEGVPPPVPIILRFPDAPRADETARQIAVLKALGRDGAVGDPVVLTLTDELDFVGPFARRMLDLVGPQVPANMYSHLPLLDAAGGGTLVTGFGGDQLIGGHGRRPRVRARLVAALPPGVEAVLRPPAELPWLTPAARRRCRELLTARRRWRLLPPRERLAREAGSRFTALAHSGLARLANCCDARIEHPLFDPRFLARLADLVDVLPPMGRTPLYRLLAGNRLPAVVTDHHPKAALTEAFQRSATHAAVASFDPGRLPTGVLDLVDVDRLMDIWRTSGPVRSTGLLLHLALAAGRQPISPLSPPGGPGAV